MKTCPDCGELKPLDEFGLLTSAPDGHARYCKPCFRRRSQASYRKRRGIEGRTVRVRVPRVEGQKRCPKCGDYKPLEDFPRNRSTWDGLAAYCKPCHNAKGKETYTRLYGGTREYHLRRRYGIGQIEVDQMLEEQGGKCAICRRPDPEHVDHDHATGKVRGMLCFNCNQALGNVRDQLVVLGKMQDYLMKAGAEPASYIDFRFRRAIVEFAGSTRHTP
ncbi:MAG: endonuclease VII domain-containing protein [Frankiaceae bacterium]|nr:endonuclease VII domain-containing protein [Frankiaceae bacterium]